jgi:hypothetical protein
MWNEQSLRTTYPPGTVMRVRVVRSDPSRERLLLSLNLRSSSTHALTPGHVVSATLHPAVIVRGLPFLETRPKDDETEAEEDAQDEDGEDEDEEDDEEGEDEDEEDDEEEEEEEDDEEEEEEKRAVSTSSSADGVWLRRSTLVGAVSVGKETVWGEVPWRLLADDVDSARVFRGAMDVALEGRADGMRVKNLVVVQRRSGPLQCAVVSSGAARGELVAVEWVLARAPLLAHVASSGASVVHVLTGSAAVGSLVVGFVASMTEFGAFVRGLDGSTGLVPRTRLSDRLVASPEGLMAVGDSVVCVVDAWGLPLDPFDGLHLTCSGALQVR